VTLEPGKTHDLTDDEINDILAVTPGALSTTATVDLSEEGKVNESDSKKMTSAEKKAAEKATKEAEKATKGPSTAGGADL
jgi:hypothetical protein